ncbi:MAG: CopG family transcriptional regulator [Rhodanobacteraceae bacterium]
MPLENRTARLTVLVDPNKKAVFEQLCAAEDTTPSQVIRRLVRGYIEQRLGRPWQPGENAPTAPRTGAAPRRGQLLEEPPGARPRGNGDRAG